VRTRLVLAECGLVVNVLVLAVLYSPASAYVGPGVILSFLVAFLTFASALFVLNGRRLGRVSLEQFWRALSLIPRWAQAGLGLLYVATLVQVLLSSTHEQSSLGFDRTYVTVTLCIAAIGTALHYAVQQGFELGPDSGRFRVVRAVFLAVGAVAVVVWFLTR
jgi:hypothetical protein